MKHTTIIIAVGLALAATLPAVPAQALTSRAWVSGLGTDAPSCGGVTTPCRTPQYAHDNIVAAGGEIDIHDPAGYGAITITKAISIVNDGVGTAGMLAPAAGNAITINAGASDAIQLRGLTIEGAGVGYNGIVFNSGGSLTVTNCVAQNFVYSGSFPSGVGVLIQSTSGAVDFSITNTIVTNDGGAGIAYHVASGSPIAHGVIDHVAAVANPVGISIEPSLTSPTAISISNSVASNNSNDGIFVDGPATVSIDNTNISGNINVGISAAGTPKVLLGRSVVTGNGTGIQNNTSPNTFYTYKDNRINENTTDITSPLNTTLALQ